MPERYLIVGLGNPGKKYEKTRHNLGFMVVDELARRYGMSFGKTERKAKTTDGMIREKRVLLVKPQTYMNESGVAVRKLVDFYKIELLLRNTFSLENILSAIFYYSVRLRRNILYVSCCHC